jgi:hypothetical protein
MEDLEIKNFPLNGFGHLGKILDPVKCRDLANWIDAKRPLNSDIFYQSEAEFESSGRWKNYSPGRNDHNLLLSSDLNLEFIEQNDLFKESMQKLCGTDWTIFKKSIIRSVPSRVLPHWAKEKLSGVGRPNINPFIKDEFQDVQYFLTTDFHQDKTRKDSDFVTVYIYIDDVSENDSALYILLGSHTSGMSCYPHNLRRDNIDKDLWYYSNQDLNTANRGYKVTGQEGSVVGFHCLTLHGTGYNNSANPRISLRYLISRGSSEKTDNCLLHKANQTINGPLYIQPNRTDISNDGSFKKTGSTLLSYGN